jgi:hypothetical protein
MDTSGDNAFLAVGLAPTTPGAMSIDLARVKSVEEWAKSFETPLARAPRFSPR